MPSTRDLTAVSPQINRSRRLVIAALDPARLMATHAPLITTAVAARHTVHCLLPPGTEVAHGPLRQLGAACETVVFAASGFSPLAAYRVRRDLSVQFATLAPHALLIEPGVPIAPLAAAAHGAGVPIIAARLGAGATIEGRALKALPDVTDVVTPSADQQRHLQRALGRTARVAMLPPSTIDHATQAHEPLPRLADGLIVRCVTASDDIAAHQVFQAAVRRVASALPHLRFATGRQADQIAAAHVVVHLPATPLVDPPVLTALALGRPLIVSDLPGLRDLVDERVNGWRVTPGSVESLAGALRSAAALAPQLDSLARASRTKSERHHDRRQGTMRLLSLLGLGMAAAPDMSPQTAAA